MEGGPRLPTEAVAQSVPPVEAGDVFRQEGRDTGTKGLLGVLMSERGQILRFSKWLQEMQEYAGSNQEG